MQIGIIGLGRMGANIGRRLMGKGHAVVGFDRDAKAVAGLTGATGAANLKDLVAKLSLAARCVGDVAGRQDHRRHHHGIVRPAVAG